MPGANGAARSRQELEKLPLEELRALDRHDVDASKDPVAYEETRLAIMILTARGLRERSDVVQERELRQRADSSQTEIKRRKVIEKLKRAREEGAIVPIWWIESGKWASMRPSEAKALIGLVALVDPGRNNEAVTYEQLADTAHVGFNTARRAVEEGEARGLIRKYLKQIPGTNPPRHTCFYTIVREKGAR